MSLRSPLGRVRGLGSAKEGVSHWWHQRLTALFLIPLVVWFVVALLSVVHADHEGLKVWVGRPLNAGLLVTFLGAMFFHAKLGLQVVIEDYVHTELVKLGAIVLMNFLVFVLGATAVISVLRIAFGG